MTNTITSNLDELIEQERRRAAERIAKLKRAAAAEQKRVDARVIELLKAQKPDLYGRLSAEARAALDAEKASRSARAKGRTSTEQGDPAPEATDQVDHHDGGAPTWEG